MARFFLNIINSIGSAPDEEGIELDSLDMAIEQAKDGVRSIIADEARSGRIDFDGRVEIVDGNGTILTVVPFPSAFEINPPAGRAKAGS
jgi:hypothetical protein